MIVLTVILYILGITLALVIALCLFILFAPIRYQSDGGYDKTFQTTYHVSYSPLLAFRGNWDSAPGAEIKTQIVVFGIPFSISPEKAKKKKKKEEKKGGDVPFFKVMGSLDRALIKNGIVFLGDILSLLKPAKFALNARIGFDEPHLTGWLAAFIYTLKYCGPAGIKLDIEPVWDEEHYEFNYSIEGRLLIAALAFRTVRFLLAGRTREFLKTMRKERKAYAV